jgi:hypothetical protein
MHLALSSYNIVIALLSNPPVLDFPSMWEFYPPEAFQSQLCDYTTKPDGFLDFHIEHYSIVSGPLQYN